MCVCECICGLDQRCAVLYGDSCCISLWSENVCPQTASGLSIRSQSLK